MKQSKYKSVTYSLIQGKLEIEISSWLSYVTKWNNKTLCNVIFKLVDFSHVDKYIYNLKDLFRINFT